MRNLKGQQEMVGFVLIVVLVVIAIMSFLIFSFINVPEKSDSLRVEVLIGSIMKMTTKCAIVYEPDYDDYGELFKSCYQNKRCSNLEVDACEYLNSSLKDLMEDLTKGENIISYYELDFASIGDTERILKIDGGNCTSGNILGSQRSLISQNYDLIVKLKLCIET
tara:strand:+ start:797 stop:1291 length:495 start_codon:yes stop_codon:yes gene_type:complete